VRRILPAFLLLAALVSAQAPDTAEKVRRARDLVVAGKTEEAIALYEELVRSAPRDAALRMNLSIAQFKAGRYHEAIAHAEEALRLQPALFTANLFLGASYLELGNPSLAIAPLEKFIAAQPKDRNARLMLARATLALDRYDDAATHYQAAADLMPQNPAAWYGLGVAYEALSARAFSDLERSAPDSAYFHALLGDALLAGRRYGAAAEHYRQALAQQPPLPGVHAGLAAVYRETGRADQAASEDDAEKKLPPPDCTSQQLACDFMAGRYREVIAVARTATSPQALYWTSKACRQLAKEAYERLERLPPSPERHILAAKGFEKRSLYPDAVREWREANRLSPADPAIQTGLAVALFHARDHAGALPLLERLIQRQPGSADLRFLYGACLANLEQPEKAVPYLEQALKDKPDFLPARAALGQAYLRLGKPAESIPHLKASLPADEDGSRHFQLVRAYQLAGQPDLARQALAAYQAFRKSLEARKIKEEGLDIYK